MLANAMPTHAAAVGADSIIDLRRDAMLCDDAKRSKWSSAERKKREMRSKMEIQMKISNIGYWISIYMM